MTPGIIFISHRAEYTLLAKRIRDAIQQTSGGKIEVFISEQIPAGDDWREKIENVLTKSETLLLLYGAPNEDWSWCFYEVGYFSALKDLEGDRRILCVGRPNIPVPGPINHIQNLRDNDQLINSIKEIYSKNKINFKGKELESELSKIDLFSEINEYINFKKVYFYVDDAAFNDTSKIPSSAIISSTEGVLNDLFSIGRDKITWAELLSPTDRKSQEAIFYSKWLDEMTRVILAAREKRYVPAQTLLVGRQGRRFRFLLYAARTQGDGKFFCEFLAIDEVGGPPLGLSCQLLTLLTSIRMAFRFRFELIEKFYLEDDDEISDEHWKTITEEFPRLMSDLLTESEARGNVAIEDLVGAFDEDGAARMRRINRLWPLVQESLTTALQSTQKNTDPSSINQQITTFRMAFEALQLINIEFLSRCCARVAEMMLRSDDELATNATRLENIVKDLKRVKAAAAQ